MSNSQAGIDLSENLQEGEIKDTALEIVIKTLEKMADFLKIRKNEDNRQTDDGVDFIRPLHQQIN